MPAPRSQTRSRIMPAVADRGRDADIGALGKQRVVFEGGPERGEIDRIGVGDKERRVRVADVGADRSGERAGREIGAQSCPSAGPAGCRANRCAPRPYRPRCGRPPAARHRAARRGSRSRTCVRPSSWPSSQATQRVALPQAPASLPSALKKRIERIGAAAARCRLDHDQLVAADAGVAVGERARRGRIDRERFAARRRARRNRCRARASCESRSCAWPRLYGGRSGPVQQGARV